jgi:hypothetical protein
LIESVANPKPVNTVSGFCYLAALQLSRSMLRPDEFATYRNMIRETFTMCDTTDD